MAVDPEALVITGVYGVGKTTTTGQVADLLGARDVRFAAIDLDWLSWAWTPEGEQEGSLDQLMLEQLDLVVRNLRRRGNDRFVLAGAVMSIAQWDALRTVLGMPTRLVRLLAPIDEVRRRLANEPTTGRLDDTRRAEAWLADPPADLPRADLEQASDRSIPEIAQAILEWSGWLDAPG